MKGAVRLFREWSIEPRKYNSSDVVLAGQAFRHYSYIPGVNVSQDLTMRFYTDEPGPVIGNGPGFYGYFKPDGGYLREFMSGDYETACGEWSYWRAVGTILGFGKVRIFERGAVCEKAVVESIFVPPPRLLARIDVDDPVRDPDSDQIISPEAVLERHRRLAEYYKCLLIPVGVAGELPGGFVEGQPVPGVSS